MALVTANEMHFHLTRICPLIYNYCILHLVSLHNPATALLSIYPEDSHVCVHMCVRWHGGALGSVSQWRKQNQSDSVSLERQRPLYSHKGTLRHVLVIFFVNARQ